MAAVLSESVLDQNVLPALLQKLVGFGKFGGKFGGNFAGILRDPQNKGSTISGEILSGPVRDTPPYRAIPFRDSIAEGGIAPICLVFIGYRTGVAEIPLLRGGYRTSTSHSL